MLSLTSQEQLGRARQRSVSKNYKGMFCSVCLIMVILIYLQSAFFNQPIPSLKYLNSSLYQTSPPHSLFHITFVVPCVLATWKISSMELFGQCNTYSHCKQYSSIFRLACLGEGVSENFLPASKKRKPFFTDCHVFRF